MFSLEGKVAVVTGGASGIGLATARRFANAGARVAIADITDASAIAKELGGLFVRTDVSKEEQVKVSWTRRPRIMDRLIERDIWPTVYD